MLALGPLHAGADGESRRALRARTPAVAVAVASLSVAALFLLFFGPADERVGLDRDRRVQLGQGQRGQRGPLPPAGKGLEGEQGVGREAGQGESG